MPRTNRQYNYHKLARQTGFIKKPSQNEKRELGKKIAKQIRKSVSDYDDRYTVIDEDGTAHNFVDKASDKRYGIFNKKGYRAIKLFMTRESAEEELSSWRKPEYYDIREIEWFEEDKERNDYDN